MPYPSFDFAKPSTAPGTYLTTEMQALRDNLMVIVHNIVAFGICVGWNRQDAGGTPLQPATRTWSRGTNRVMLTMTYGTSGGANGNVTQVVVDYSPDSGATWQRIGTYTLTWATDGTSPSDSWS